MAVLEAVASTFNLPNYTGQLYMLDPLENVFLGLLGFSAEGGGRVETNYEFQINFEDLPDPSQPAILEGAAIPDPIAITQTNAKNVTQIFNEATAMTYSRTASFGRIDGSAGQVHTFGAPMTDPTPFARQEMRLMDIIKRKVNYTFINGVYANPANPTSSARKTRGWINAVDSGNVVDAGGADLERAHIQELLRTMWMAGALRDLSSTYFVVNAYNKQRITDIYGYAPEDRNVGGMNIKQIETDFGTFGIILERDMPTSVVGLVNFAIMTPVFNLVHAPDGTVKGVLFSEDVPQTTTSYKRHIYGEIGLDHGPGEWHGKIINTATAPAA
jgi:hypothetical protein